jgi:trehalose synthase
MGSLLRAYRSVAGPAAVDAFLDAARPLRGVRVLHVCSSGRGGGVAELLKRQVPLMREIGIEVRWLVLRGDPAFLAVTKDIHRALQGDPRTLSPEAWARFEDGALRWAADHVLDADAVVIHDPQPLPLVLLRNRVMAAWIWRCHIDLMSPAASVWAPVLQRYVLGFDASIVSNAEAATALPSRACISAPSIDPLSDKNRQLPDALVKETIGRYGLGKRPYLLQVARFDAFKDPVGVVRAFRAVRQQVDCELVLASGSAEDDPEQVAVLEEVQAEAAGLPDIRLLLLEPDLDLDINALQRGAAVIVQKSLREGFGLPVAEAMWKGKCVVGGRTSGISLQITEGVNGYLVDSVAEAAERIVMLLRDRRRTEGLGPAARESVRRRFLIIRELTDYCELIGGLLRIRTASRSVPGP